MRFGFIDRSRRDTRERNWLRGLLLLSNRRIAQRGLRLASCRSNRHHGGQSKLRAPVKVLAESRHARINFSEEAASAQEYGMSETGERSQDSATRVHTKDPRTVRC